MKQDIENLNSEGNLHGYQESYNELGDPVFIGYLYNGNRHGKCKIFRYNPDGSCDTLTCFFDMGRPVSYPVFAETPGLTLIF